eukprot:Phypoly_transcript_04679.p1 GENE.Phypoly_transcript_04679~~Phypoly_transcript_04679.p1  ORF type:complete len:669 (+),score=68.95 Phypoly_transcript_04679:107-2113(+)
MLRPSTEVHHVAINQDHLQEVIRQIFPKDQIAVNARKESTLQNPVTGLFLELDLVLPERGICFEFQDHYHYTSTWYAQVPVLAVQNKDAQKKNMVNKIAISLIVVPYWWDGQRESLMATINFYRPDLELATDCPPIFLNRSSESTNLVYSVKGVGEVMLASFPEKTIGLRHLISSQNPWWMGEKYDGIRAIWNPEERALYSRFGNTIDIPSHHSFLKAQLSAYLDGEIWFGRGCYLSAFRLTNTIDNDIADFRLLIFDNPSVEMQQLPFEHRYASALVFVSTEDPISIVVTRTLCHSNEHRFWVHSIISDGGEGIMLRKTNSLYERGRNSSLLKLKAFQGDTEALVVDLGPENCTLKLPSGITFAINLPSLKLQIGDIVTLEYNNYSDKDLIPISPTVGRVRSDLIWENVVHDYLCGKHSPPILDSISKSLVSRQGNDSLHEPGDELFKNRRSFFEKFARENNFDPLVVDNWYSVKQKILLAKKGFKMIKKWYGGKIGHALEHLFPDIGFSKEKYYQYHWTRGKFYEQSSNRRHFFKQIAKKLGFDPLVAENWYSTGRYAFTSHKDGLAVLAHHNQDHKQALVDSFPEIGLSEKGFTREVRWDFHSKREIFENYAKQNEFDPLHPENWLLQRNAILSSKEVKRVIAYSYHNNVSKAVRDLFPEIKFAK